jgi:hypothetical protein
VTADFSQRPCSLRAEDVPRHVLSAAGIFRTDVQVTVTGRSEMSIEKPAISWRKDWRSSINVDMWCAEAKNKVSDDAVGSWTIEAGPSDQTCLPVAPSN